MATNSIKLLTGNSHPQLAKLVADKWVYISLLVVSMRWVGYTYMNVLGRDRIIQIWMKDWSFFCRCLSKSIEVGDNAGRMSANEIPSADWVLNLQRL